MRCALPTPAVCAVICLLMWAHPVAAETEYSLRLLPFTGITLPNQDLAAYAPGLPLGAGLEVHYSRRLSLVLEGTAAWHRGGPEGREDLFLSGARGLARWRFPDRHFAPFLQAGIGGYQAELDGSGGEQQYGGVGLALGAGGEIELGKPWALELELGTHAVRGSRSTGSADRWIGHSQIHLWLRYRLP